MTPETPTPASQDRPTSAKPCIHTLETGKHEWNCFHWVHQAHAPFSYPQCPTCGWIDLDLMVKEAGLAKAGREDESRRTLMAYVNRLRERADNATALANSAATATNAVLHSAWAAAYLSVADELAALPAQTETCEWKRNQFDAHETSCDAYMGLGIYHHVMRFCYNCGKPLREVPFNG